MYIQLNTKLALYNNAVVSQQLDSFVKGPRPKKLKYIHDCCGPLEWKALNKHSLFLLLLAESREILCFVGWSQRTCSWKGFLLIYLAITNKKAFLICGVKKLHFKKDYFLLQKCGGYTPLKLHEDVDANFMLFLWLFESIHPLKKNNGFE